MEFISQTVYSLVSAAGMADCILAILIDSVHVLAGMCFYLHMLLFSMACKSWVAVWPVVLDYLSMSSPNICFLFGFLFVNGNLLVVMYGLCYSSGQVVHFGMVLQT